MRSLLHWLSSREGRQFLRFCVTGTVGFLSDALFLAGFIYGGGTGPVLGRVCSTSLAILVTFTLNRNWTFKPSVKRSIWAELAYYVAAQSFGPACNPAIYSAMVLALKGIMANPFFALAIASAGAMMVNYLGARFFVFRTE